MGRGSRRLRNDKFGSAPLHGYSTRLGEESLEIPRDTQTDLKETLDNSWVRFKGLEVWGKKGQSRIFGSAGHLWLGELIFFEQKP